MQTVHESVFIPLCSFTTLLKYGKYILYVCSTSIQIGTCPNLLLCNKQFGYCIGLPLGKSCKIWVLQRTHKRSCWAVSLSLSHGVRPCGCESCGVMELLICSERACSLVTSVLILTHVKRNPLHSVADQYHSSRAAHIATVHQRLKAGAIEAPGESHYISTNEQCGESYF